MRYGTVIAGLAALSACLIAFGLFVDVAFCGAHHIGAAFELLL